MIKLAPALDPVTKSLASCHAITKTTEHIVEWGSTVRPRAGRSAADTAQVPASRQQRTSLIANSHNHDSKNVTEAHERIRPIHHLLRSFLLGRANWALQRSTAALDGAAAATDAGSSSSTKIKASLRGTMKDGNACDVQPCAFGGAVLTMVGWCQRDAASLSAHRHVGIMGAS